MDDWGRIFGREAQHEQTPSPLRRPETWPAVAGFALTVAGLIVPWATFSGTGGSADIGPAARGGEGGLATVGAAVVVAVLTYRPTAESRTRTVQLLPAVVGVLALGMMIVGVQSTLLAVANPTLVIAPVGLNGSYAYASTGSLGVGVWISLAGAILVAVGGIVGSIGMIRRNGVYVERYGRDIG